jgi:hypothetical protein
LLYVNVLHLFFGKWMVPCKSSFYFLLPCHLSFYFYYSVSTYFLDLTFNSDCSLTLRNFAAEI